MKPEEMLLKKEEQVSFSLRALFEQYGYRKFKMSKFEEYDFYAENRSFLHSEAILTFTGLDGKLLALKPDVTLSIVKNTKGSRDTAERKCIPCQKGRWRIQGNHAGWLGIYRRGGCIRHA